MEKYGGLDKQELIKLKKLGRHSRWFCLRRTFPVVMMHEHGAFLRGSDDKDEEDEDLSEEIPDDKVSGNKRKIQPELEEKEPEFREHSPHSHKHKRHKHRHHHHHRSHHHHDDEE